MRNLGLFIIGLVAFFDTFSFLTGTVEATEAWQVRWGKTMEEGKKEGKVVIYGQGDWKVFVEGFQRAHPGIHVSFTAGRSSQLAYRILAERRAGKFLVDLFTGSPNSPVTVFKPAGILNPIRPILILPEVVDTSAWLEKKLWFADNEKKYTLMWNGTVSALFAINTNLVRMEEIKSYWDLIKPKWKGKIAVQDPTAPGSGPSLSRFLYVTPDYGPEFLRRLFGEMDVTISRNRFQIVDWLATGKFSIILFTPLRKNVLEMGLPIRRGYEVQGPKPVGSGSGSVSFLERSPHPNAAAVFVNWLLSREGQNTYQNVTGNNSLRTDIPKEVVAPGTIPKGGRENMYFYHTEEHIKSAKSQKFRAFLRKVISRR